MADKPSAGLAVGKEIERICELVGEMSHIGQRVPFIEEAEYFFIPAGKYKNYLIFYTLDGENVIVRRIIHARRDIRALFE